MLFKELKVGDIIYVKKIQSNGISLLRNLLVISCQTEYGYGSIHLKENLLVMA